MLLLHPASTDVECTNILKKDFGYVEFMLLLLKSFLVCAIAVTKGIGKRLGLT